jgi:adenine-specific DNA glycosylase
MIPELRGARICEPEAPNCLSFPNPFQDGINLLEENNTRAYSLYHVRTQQERALTRTELADIKTSDFTEPDREINIWCLSHPVYGIYYSCVS